MKVEKRKMKNEEQEEKTNSLLLQGNFMFLKRLSFHAQYFLCIIHDITLKQQRKRKKSSEEMISFRR